MSTRIDASSTGGWSDDFDAGSDADFDDNAADLASTPVPQDDTPAEAPAGIDVASPESWSESFGLPDNADAREQLAESTSPDTAGETAAAVRTAVVQRGQGVLRTLSEAGVADDDLPAAYGALVASGQLRPADFHDGSPVVQPGRSFELDAGSLTDDNAALGKRLIATEHRGRVAATVAAVQSLTRATPAERDADTNYRVAADAQARQAAYRPPAAVPAAASPGLIERSVDTVQDLWDGVAATVSTPRALSGSFQEVTTSWATFKADTRRDNEAIAVADAGGPLTAAVAFTAAPRELGFALVDAGLALGGTVLDVADSARAGTLVKDAVDTFGPVSQRVAEAVRRSDTFRVSFSVNDAKLMVGTDRVGVQYKTTGRIDEVTRLTYGWGANQPTIETVLEKNLGSLRVPAGRVAGVPLKVDVVPGLRQNVTGSRAVTPSLNIDVTPNLEAQTKLKVKVSFEVRQSGS